MRLTKKVIEAATHPASGQVFLRDSGLQGFGVRLTPGAKSFILERFIHGRVRRMTLGRYGELTLDQARDLAREKIGEIAKGSDPAEERRRHRQSATWGDLERLYLERHAIHKKSRRNDEGFLKNHLAHWRTRKLVSITREEIIRLHAKLGAEPSTVVRPGSPAPRPAPRLANSVLALIRSMLNLATDWGLYGGSNPCVRIKKFPEVKRDRFVTPDELPALFQAMQEEKNVFVRAAFFVSLLTGARRAEVLTMRWADLDCTQGLWRIPETKSGRVHLLPLPHPVLDELQKLPRLAGNEFVFVGRWGKGHLVNITKPWTRIRTAAGLEDVRIHDLRRTLGSWLVAQGHSLPLIGKALNHSSISTTQIYARLQLDPVREALEHNAERMLAVIATAAESKHATAQG